MEMFVIYPVGIKLKKCEIDKEVLDDNEYYEDDSYESLDDITEPKKNHVYTILDSDTIEVYRTEIRDAQ